MKHFYSLLFFAATALTTQAAETIYECPLNTQEQADEWTVINSNNDSNDQGVEYTWAFDKYFGVMGCSTVNPDMAADDWLISPAIDVEEGMYMLTFEFRGSSSGEKMDVFYGETPTASGMDNLLLDLNSEEGSFITQTKMFSINESGKIHIGFHAKSDAWSYQVAIRNVKLATSEGKDLQAVEVNTAKSGYNLGTAPVKLTIYNNGAADASNFQVAYKINDNAAVTESVTATVKAGDTYEHTFAQQADFSATGSYAIKAWTALEGDELPGNDNCETSLQHCDISEVPYSTSFEAGENIADIIFLDLNDDPADEENGEWGIVKDDGWFSNFARTGENSLCYFYSSDHPGDDWAFMPAMHLTPGYYAVKFWYSGMDGYPEKMKLSYGELAEGQQTPTPESMTQVVVDYPEVANSTYTESANVIHIEKEGDYIFGFYCYSDASQNILAVDDFSVTSIENEESDLSVSLVSPTADYFVKGSSSSQIAYSVVNNGIETMTSTTVNVTIDGETVATDEIETIAAQETKQFITPDVLSDIATGMHTLRIELSNSDDQVASNNVAELTFKVVENAVVIYDFETDEELDYGEKPALPEGFIFKVEDSGTVNSGISDEFPNNEAWNYIEINTHELYGDWMFGAASWLDGTERADRWCIFPKVKVTGENADAVWASNSADPDFPETYEVLVSSTGTETADFEKLLTVENDANQPGLHGVDLSKYDGKEIYLAIRLVTADGYFLTIDNVGFYGNVSLAQGGISSIADNNWKVTVSSEELTCTADNVSNIAVYDMSGRFVAGSDTETVNISGLQKGIYIASITADGSTLQYKFAK